jgi:hypothetical protein
MLESLEFKLKLLFAAVLLFPLVVFILSLINSNVTPVASILDEIRSSLNDYPIEDFSYNDDCGEKYSGSIYTFPGSVEGCSCVNVHSYYYTQTGQYQLNTGTCTSNQSYNGCRDIPPKPKEKLYFWGDGKFCSKKYNTEEFKLKGYLHYLEFSVLENEECQEGYKKCGKLDDMGNYLCIKEEDQCPINDIQVTFSEDEELERLNYSHVIVNNKYFYFSSATEKPIISKLKVAEEGKLCIDRTYFHTLYPQYILDNNFMYYGCRHKINGELFEKDIQALDYKTKKQIYQDSKVYIYNKYDYLDYDYPFYSLEANMTLYAERYIGYDKKCLSASGVFDAENSPFNEDIVVNINRLVGELISNNVYIKWFSIVSTIILLSTSILLNIARDEKIWKWVLINCILYTSMGIPIYFNAAKISSINEFPICGNDLTNAKINFYHSTQRTLKVTTILSIILINLQLAFVLFMTILRYHLSTLLFKEVNDIELTPKDECLEG